MKIAILILCACALVGCGGDSAVQKERTRLESEGWAYVELVGKERDDAELFTWLKSTTAKDLGVGVVQDGKRVERRYLQDAWLYQASVFTSSSGESFALVFRKPKTT